MNKKFSTLLATFLVAGGMSSVSAQGIQQPTLDIAKIEAEKAYQLTDTARSNALIMEKVSNGSYVAKFVALASVPNLASSLWTISYTNNAVGGPDFTLVNKATGCPLSVDLSALTTTAANVNMGGSVSSWKWLDAVQSSTGAFSTGKSLYSYFHSDSVAYLAVNAAGDIQAAKAHKEQLPSMGLCSLYLLVLQVIHLQLKN